MRKYFILSSLIFLLSNQVLAELPKISGNIEQGARYAIPYDEVAFPTPWIEVSKQYEEESWAYNFNKGYLQLSQKVNDKIRYVVKYNYIWKDFFDANTNNKNVLNYYRTYSWINLNDKLDLKLEYYLRHQNYNYRPWDNFTHVPHILLKWEINKKRDLDLSLRYKSQRYNKSSETWKDKDQISTSIGYKEIFGEKLGLKANYKYTFRQYTDNPDESNAVKKSLSIGFDYQF